MSAEPEAQGEEAQRSSLKSKLYLSLSSTVFTLILVELLLRLLDIPQIPEPKQQTVRFQFQAASPGASPILVNNPGRITFTYASNPRGYFDDQNQVHHQVNDKGFRGPEFTPAPPETFRMMVLGDSFTFGEGVNDQDIFPVQAALLFSEKTSTPAVAYNLGVGSYNTTQSLELLNLYREELQPDLVVLGYTINDPEPPLFQLNAENETYIRVERDIDTDDQTPPDRLLFRSRIAKAIWNAQNQRSVTEQTIAYYQRIHQPDQAGRKESEDSLRQILQICAEQDIPCIVVMFPLMYLLNEDYPFQEIHQSIGTHVTEGGGTFIDLYPHLKNQDAASLIVHSSDHHPNERVHHLAGKLIAEEALRTRGAQGPRTSPNSPE